VDPVRVEIDASRCDGTGFCVELAPHVFVLDDDLPPSRVLVDEIDEQTAKDCHEAAAMCPTRAVVVHDRPAHPPPEGDPR
jgi:ferredoxin